MQLSKRAVRGPEQDVLCQYNIRKPLGCRRGAFVFVTLVYYRPAFPSVSSWLIRHGPLHGRITEPVTDDEES
jgi:hypothetical protein